MSSGRSSELRAVVAAAGRGRLLGVEREYEVLRGDVAVDARSLLAELAVVGPALDPGDRNARRCATGGVVTTDGRHAEIATPPVVLAPGCTSTALELAAATTAALRRALPGHRLVGYSTHLSVAVPERAAVPVARWIARHASLPLALALDRPSSPGLLVRPRPGRLEIGGEFAAGDQLRAALVWTVATVLEASRRTVRLFPARGTGPPVRPDRAVERYGWFVDRRAFGPDVYTQGRAALLGAVTAGELLRRRWRRLRPLVEPVLAADELALVDDQVAGHLPLPGELPVDEDGVAAVPVERAYHPRHRTGLTVTVTAATWWRAVLELRDGDRVRWLTVPGRALDAVLDALDDGRLDDELRRLVSGRRGTGRA